MTGEYGEKLSIDEIVVVGSAIATREVSELVRTKSLMDGPSGRVENYDPVVLHELALTRATQYISAIETPPEILSSEQFKDVLYAQSTHLSETETPDSFREATGLTDEDAAFVFKREFKAAKAMAREYQVQIVDVYTYDELHVEMLRRAFTLEELVDRSLKMLAGFSEESCTLIMIRECERLALEHDPDFDRTYLTELLIDHQLSDVFITEMQHNSRVAQERVQRIIIANIRRVWGEEALETLPEEVKNQFGIVDK